MRNQEVNNRSLLIVAIAIPLLVMAIAVAYYLVIFQPAKEKAAADAKSAQLYQEREDAAAKTIERLSNQTKLDSCLSDVDTRSHTALSAPDAKKLSREDLKLILDTFEKQKSDCYQRYPVK